MLFHNLIAISGGLQGCATVLGLFMIELITSGSTPTVLTPFFIDRFAV